MWAVGRISLVLEGSATAPAAAAATEAILRRSRCMCPGVKDALHGQ